MLRGHVPPVEAGKAHEIVTSVGKKWGHFASMHARKVGPVFCVYLPGRPAIGALTVDRQAVTWSGPSPIFHPPLLATHRGYTKLDFVEQFL
jgi:hypothetical protein